MDELIFLVIVSDASMFCNVVIRHLCGPQFRTIFSRIQPLTFDREQHKYISSKQLRRGAGDDVYNVLRRCISNNAVLRIRIYGCRYTEIQYQSNVIP